MTEVTRSFCWHQNFVPWGLSAPTMGLYTCTKSWKINCIKSDFKEIFFKLAPKWQDVLVDIKNLSPRGCQPLPRAIYMYKIMKKICIKSDFKEIFFETWSKWPKWQEVSVDIKILSPGLWLLNYEKMCIKSEVEEILFKLATNEHSDEAFLLTSKFSPKWVVCPFPGTMFKLLFLNNRWF